MDGCLRELRLKHTCGMLKKAKYACLKTDTKTDTQQTRADITGSVIWVKGKELSTFFFIPGRHSCTAETPLNKRAKRHAQNTIRGSKRV